MNVSMIVTVMTWLVDKKIHRDITVIVILILDFICSGDCVLHVMSGECW